MWLSFCSCIECWKKNINDVFLKKKVITPSSFWKLYFQEYFHFPVIISIFNLVLSDGWARGGSDRELRLSETQSLSRQTFQDPPQKKKKVSPFFLWTVEGNGAVLFNLHSWLGTKPKKGGGGGLNRKSLRKARHLQYFLYFLDFKSINWSEQETWCISAPLWSVQKIADEKKKRVP